MRDWQRQAHAQLAIYAASLQIYNSVAGVWLARIQGGAMPDSIDSIQQRMAIRLEAHAAARRERLAEMLNQQFGVPKPPDIANTFTLKRVMLDDKTMSLIPVVDEYNTQPWAAELRAAGHDEELIALAIGHYTRYRKTGKSPTID